MLKLDKSAIQSYKMGQLVEEIDSDDDGNNKLAWNLRNGVADYLQIEKYLTNYEKENSKRHMSYLLAIEEMKWHTGIERERELSELSYLSIQLTELRLFFYANFVNIVTDRFRQISYIKFKGTSTTKNLMTEQLQGVIESAEEFKGLIEDDIIGKEVNMQQALLLGGDDSLTESSVESSSSSSNEEEDK